MMKYHVHLHIIHMNSLTKTKRRVEKMYKIDVRSFHESCPKPILGVKVLDWIFEVFDWTFDWITKKIFKIDFCEPYGHTYEKVVSMNRLMKACKVELNSFPDQYPLPKENNQIRVIGWKWREHHSFVHSLNIWLNNRIPFYRQPEKSIEKVFDELMPFPLDWLHEIDQMFDSPIGNFWRVASKKIMESGGDVMCLLIPPDSGFWVESGAIIIVAKDINERATKQFFMKMAY